MTITREAIEAAIVDRLTRREACERLGCSEHQLQQAYRALGIRWPHRSRNYFREHRRERVLTIAECERVLAAHERYALLPPWERN